MTRRRTADFGYPLDVIDPHHFLVEIPAARSEPVRIFEDFGIRGGVDGVPQRIFRAEIGRTLWTAVADDVRRLFNDRLKANGLAVGRWKVGEVRVERLLGRELCLLAWAIDGLKRDSVGPVLKNWASLRPEERWWLFAVTSVNGGRAEQSRTGWRRALRLALADAPLDGEVLALPPRRTRSARNTKPVELELPFDRF